MLSNGSDNSLKLWIFDAPDGTARLLKQRSFHSAPPSKIQFYGLNRCAVVINLLINVDTCGNLSFQLQFHLSLAFPVFLLNQ